MNKFSEKQLLIGTIVVTLLAALGIGFLIWRDFGIIEAEETLVEEIKAKIKAAEAEIAKIDDREHRAIANRETGEKEVAFLPAETEIENFWEVLERFAEEAGVKISKIAPTGGRRSNRRRKGKKKTTSISSVDQVMNLRATADEFLRFINLIENHNRIINVVDFELSTGAEDSDGKIRHNLRVSLRTFTYSKKITNTIVSIPNYDQKRESTKAKEIISRIKIEEKAQYTLSTSIARRDPFVDVRQRRQEATVDGNDEREYAHQETLFRELLEQIRTLENDLSIEKILIEKNLLYQLTKHRIVVRDAYHQLENQIAQCEEKRLFTDRDLQEQFKAQIVLKFLELGKSIVGLDGSQKQLSKEHVQEKRDKIAKLFDERNWKRLAEEFRNWKSISRKGEHVVDEARALAAEIADFRRRADVIQEFDRRKISISGIVFAPNGVSIAVINSKLRGEGDALDADGRVLVAEIGENFVIFLTEGVEIKRLQVRKH